MGWRRTCESGRRTVERSDPGSISLCQREGNCFSPFFPEVETDSDQSHIETPRVTGAGLFQGIDELSSFSTATKSATVSTSVERCCSDAGNAGGFFDIPLCEQGGAHATNISRPRAVTGTMSSTFPPRTRTALSKLLTVGQTCAGNR
jgi:hypothetical protein